MKLIVFDGWEVLLMLFAVAFLTFALCERAARKAVEETEKLYGPVLALAEKWAKIHLMSEKER